MRHQSKRSVRRTRLATLGVVLVALVGAQLCFFKVDTAEYAVVTQFGRPVQIVMTPGLGVKLPYQSVNKFDNRLFVYTPPVSEFLTLEKTAVVASGVILWRIAEPRKFFKDPGGDAEGLGSRRSRPERPCRPSPTARASPSAALLI